jgi:hypothetical protein
MLHLCLDNLQKNSSLDFVDLYCSNIDVVYPNRCNLTVGLFVSAVTQTQFLTFYRTQTIFLLITPRCQRSRSALSGRAVIGLCTTMCMFIRIAYRTQYSTLTQISVRAVCLVPSMIAAKKRLMIFTRSARRIKHATHGYIQCSGTVLYLGANLESSHAHSLRFRL